MEIDEESDLASYNGGDVVILKSITILGERVAARFLVFTK